jgi:hypothetical protein
MVKSARRDPIQVVIPSLGRWKNVPKVERLFLEPIWCVAESEIPKYKKRGAKRFLPHPDSLLGTGATRQFIRDNLDNEMLFMVDDDVEYAWCNVGRVGRRIDNPEAIQQIIDNAGYMAKELGTPVFGFNMAYDVRKIKLNDPIKLDTWVSGAVGVIGDICIDQGLGLRNDIPFCLTVLEKNRIIFRDDRFAFVCPMNRNLGGLQLLRTKETDLEEQRRIEKEWGKYVEYGLSQTRTKVKVKVQRRLSINTGALKSR